MKIGILTLPLRHNYGGILQAYALQTILKRMGHDAFLVRLMPDQASFAHQMQHWLKMQVKRLLGRQVHHFCSNHTLDTVIYKELNRFIREQIHPITEPVLTVKALSALDSRELFDAYIVGSDQVWRNEYARQYLSAYFCTFSERRTRKLAYAASFGSSEWNIDKKQLPALVNGISSFHKVMVRENSGVELCRKWLNIEATVVLDPTMLLKREDYLTLLPKGRDEEKHGVFEYFLDNTEFKQNVSKQVQDCLGKPSFSIDTPNRLVSASVPLRDLAMHPIEEWLLSFERADFVVTDSFHGSVFSIIFNKPFITIGNIDRGIDRFNTLFQHFGVENALLHEGESKIITSSNFSWESINTKLAAMRAHSIRELSEGLSLGGAQTAPVA